jgi:hypothetical protein
MPRIVRFGGRYTGGIEDWESAGLERGVALIGRE